MPRAGLTHDVVVAEAAALADETGMASLTLAAVAERLGVRVPSLYKHVDGLPALHRGMAVQAKADLGDALGRAAVGKSRGVAVAALAGAYRDWALAHPGQYALTIRAGDPADTAEAEVSLHVLDIIFAVLDGYGLHETDAIDATRFFRATMHGFVSLEMSGGFAMPVDIDRSYDRLVVSVVTALETWRSEP